LAGETVLDTEIGTQSVELMRTGCRAFSQPIQAVGELLSIIRENVADLYWAGAFKNAQKRRALAAVFLL